MRYVKKEFLDDSPDESGFIVCSVESPQEEHMSSSWCTIAATAQIGDCQGRVYLDFNVALGKDGGIRLLQKRLAKLDFLIQNLTEFRTNLAQIGETTAQELQKLREKEAEDKKDE